METRLSIMLLNSKSIICIFFFLTSVVLSGYIQNFSTTEGKKKFGLRSSTLPNYVTSYLSYFKGALEKEPGKLV